MRHRSFFPGTPTSGDIDTIFRQGRYVHIRFLVSTVVFGLLGILIKLFIINSEPGFVGLSASTYSFLFTLLAIISIALIFIILYVLPRRNSAQNLVEREGISSSEELGKVLYIAHMARISLAQGIAVLGLVLFLLNGNLIHLFGFGVVAFVLLLLTFPRWSEWDEAQALIDKDRI